MAYEKKHLTARQELALRMRNPECAESNSLLGLIAQETLSDARITHDGHAVSLAMHGEFTLYADLASLGTGESATTLGNAVKSIFSNHSISIDLARCEAGPFVGTKPPRVDDREYARLHFTVQSGPQKLKDAFCAAMKNIRTAARHHQPESLKLIPGPVQRILDQTASKNNPAQEGQLER